MSEWIKYSDRMPECGQEVIVYLVDSRIGVYAIIDATYDNGLFYIHDTDFKIDTMDVTHWMPRPILEPPKE